MKKKKLSTRAKALIVYAAIIVIALVVILFIIPDHVFYNIYNKKVNDETTEKKDDFVSIEKAEENLSKNKYSYEYIILDSIGTKSYSYKCKGTKNDKLESGTCTSPKKVSYTEKDKAKVFKELQAEFLEPQKVFNLLKDIKPKTTKYQSSAEYEYNTQLDKLDTTIKIETDKENITKIEIMNGYMSYILKYSNVEY